MSSSGVADDSCSSAPVPGESFRFSPRPNLAHTIHWRSWGEAAFQEAMMTDKPILLIISSTWCYWCHLLDESTLSQPEIIAIINSDYIPIRVDSDLRPDVNHRYNQNGWPSVVMLSAEGEVLWGGVYVPPKQMLYYLGHIRRYYSEHRAEISEQVYQLQNHRLTRKLTHALAGSSLRPLLEDERAALCDIPREAGRVLRDLYDAAYGGFCIHPHLKFPHADALLLLLLLGSHEQPEALEMVRYSLEQMRDGGLWDVDEGGFFRYSAASDWGMPHTEKMLEENAALLQVTLLTAQKIQEGEWYDLARRLIFYINSTLWQTERGVFSGSQSADEEYYEPGPYSRASKQAPQVDTTIYTAWNARMISSYLLASRVLENPTLEGMALRALDWLCEHMLHRNGSVYHYALKKRAELPGQLADLVWMTYALLDAYDMRKQKAHLEAAIALMEFACRELLDEQSGLFYDYPEDLHAVGRLLLQEQPLVENALAAECLLRMCVYSKHKHLRDTALLVLSGCQAKYRRAGIQGVIYACVIARAVEHGWL